MKRLAGLIMFLMCTMLAAAAVQAESAVKEVVLKDGGVIECRNVWMADGKVMVLVNRDTLLDLSKDEVDLSKTFPKHQAKHKALKKKKRHPHRAQTVPVDKPQAKPAAEKPAPTAAAEPTVKESASTPPKPKSSKEGTPAAPSKPAAGPPPVSAKTVPAATPAGPPRTTPPVAAPAPTPRQILAASLANRDGIIGNLLYIFLVSVIMVVAMCKIFAKAGQAWWKALIPIYSLFVFVSIAGKEWWWVLLLCIPILNIAFFFLIHIALARRFGQGALFGVGLALVGVIFFPLLAFGKSEYS
jgi:hypothetical protein